MVNSAASSSSRAHRSCLKWSPPEALCRRVASCARIAAPPLSDGERPRRHLSGALAITSRAPRVPRPVHAPPQKHAEPGGGAGLRSLCCRLIGPGVFMAPGTSGHAAGRPPTPVPRLGDCPPGSPANPWRAPDPRARGRTWSVKLGPGWTGGVGRMSGCLQLYVHRVGRRYTGHRSRAGNCRRGNVAAGDLSRPRSAARPSEPHH